MSELGAAFAKFVAIIVLLGACASFVLGPSTPDVQTASDQIAADVCSVWLSITYDSTLDSPETVTEVQAGNRARDAYCEET